MRNAFRRATIGLLVSFAASGAGPTGRAHAEGPAADAALEALQAKLVRVIERAEASVVAISRTAKPPKARATVVRPGGADAGVPAQDPLRAIRRARPTPPPHAHGAGVVVQEGLVLTQFQVVDAGDDHTVTTLDGSRHPTELIAADPRSGLAVLKVTATAGRPFNAPPLAMGAAEDLRKGNFVVAIGNPFAIQSDGQPTASWGVVANTARRAPAGEDLNGVRHPDGTFRTTLHHFGTLIQTDARLGWNASGGPLVTLNGELVGVLTTASTIAGHERPAGYAIPINALMRRVVGTLLEGEEPEYGLLGVTFNATPGAADGVVISAAYRGGPGGRAGLLPGDRLVRVADDPVTDPESLQLLINRRPPGSVVPLTYERRGQRRETTATLGKAFIAGEKVVTKRRPAWRGLRVDHATAAPGDVLARSVAERKLDPEGCVLVTEVEPGSVSARLGVPQYAYISHVDGERVSTPDEFYAAVAKAPDTARLKFTKPLDPPPQAAPNR